LEEVAAAQMEHELRIKREVGSQPEGGRIVLSEVCEFCNLPDRLVTIAMQL
jgi:hypothetical protein